MLESRRLRLRKVLVADAGSITDLCFYDGVAASNEQEAAVVLERIERDYLRGESLHWGICLEGGEGIVGTCGFYRGFEDNTGEVGYVLQAGSRGQGIMTEALELVVSFGFEALGLDRIVAHTSHGNERSIAVLRRVGFDPVPTDFTSPPAGPVTGEVTYALDRSRRSR